MILKSSFQEACLFTQPPIELGNETKIQFLLLMVDLDCHLDRIQNHTGCEPLGMFVRGFLNWVEMGGNHSEDWGT